MQLKEGSELQNGKYRIIRVLGQGGFGITYLAENTYFDRNVAIKEFFPKDFCGRDNTSHLTLGTQNNAETVEKLKDRFLKEAKNIAKLDHPGIIKIHDIFEENNTAYYVMDYIEGENLNEMVKHQGPLSEAKAVEYIRKVGDALDYIHSRNMTHFDVKPANIMVRRSDDQPILIDFGLSKQYDSHGDATSTLMQGVSHGYSPIELYNPGSITSFSPQTDVYSLGATLYYLLTGNVPPTASNVLENGLNIYSDVSEAAAEVISKTMSFSRKHRPQNIESFLIQLNKRDPTEVNGSERFEEKNEETIIISVDKNRVTTMESEEIDSKFDEPSDNSLNYINSNNADSINSIPEYKSSSIGTERDERKVIICIAAIIVSIILFFVLKKQFFNSNTTHEDSDYSEELSDPDGYHYGHGWIDLGLPSGTKWAYINLAGDVSLDKSTERYSEDVYDAGEFWRANWSEVFNDSIGIWEGNWMLPTMKDYIELFQYCDFSNDYNGITIRGKNGKSLFLPKCGYMDKHGEVVQLDEAYFQTTSGIMHMGVESIPDTIQYSDKNKSNAYLIRPVLR